LEAQLGGKTGVRRKENAAPIEIPASGLSYDLRVNTAVQTMQAFVRDTNLTTNSVKEWRAHDPNRGKNQFVGVIVIDKENGVSRVEWNLDNNKDYATIKMDTASVAKFEKYHPVGFLPTKAHDVIVALPIEDLSIAHAYQLQVIHKAVGLKTVDDSNAVGIVEVGWPSRSWPRLRKCSFKYVFDADIKDFVSTHGE
jgi:hypothetical protein